MLLIGGNLAVALVSPPARNLRARHYRSALQRMYEACRFIRDDAGKGHVLVAGSAGFVPVWTGRSAVSVLSYVQDDGCRMEGIPDAVGYVLFTEDDFMPYRENYLEPWFKTVEPHFTLVYADRETKVWRRKPL